MSTYTIIKGVFGHLGLCVRQSRDSSVRIAGDKPWGGGTIVGRFRSRSHDAAKKRFTAYKAAAR